MASIRTARALAAVSALPLAAALFTGVAAADDGASADSGSDVTAATATAGVLGSGTGGDDSGNSDTMQQQAVGSDASNENNSFQVNGSAFTTVHQGNDNVTINFSPLW
ncbi:hypothetical protein [Streptomyces prasinopilosus]|uniref:Secreted protein n=1 Tax=Streptomyces prasinopilosus TaxID=67344 RepID=A0A1G6XAU7_9ACTN|nr:hypothetical protein [Streptomyces prasinopilosus]SDD74405.1 hypothetical protein SAMN05216505_111111 [Streptomyces prasinopilosus]